jgi:hypothetical protein
LPQITGRTSFLLGQKSPLNGDITRGLLDGTYSGQALEFIRPEATVFVFRHALARASGIMNLGMGVSGQDTGGEEDDTNRDDKNF